MVRMLCAAKNKLTLGQYACTCCESLGTNKKAERRVLKRRETREWKREANQR